MRRSRLLLAAIAATATAASLAACGSGASQSSTTATVDSLARAADVTTQSGGARIAFSGAFEGQGSPHIVLSGAGRSNFAAHEEEFAMKLGGLPAAVVGGGGTLPLLERFKDGTVYVTSPLLAGRLPEGARWIAIDISQVAQGLGLDSSSLTGGLDPTQYLQELRAAGATPTALGQEQVRGVQTTRYHASVDVKKLAEQQLGPHSGKVSEALSKVGVTEVPIEAWIDAQGRVRKIALDVHESGGAGLQMAVEYFGFGPVPPVSAPPASQVFHVTGQALQGLSALGQAG